MQYDVAAERLSVFYLKVSIKILYLPEVHSQGREDDAGVVSFIN